MIDPHGSLSSIKEKSKKVKIGAEKNKICPTELGIKKLD
jgi:hypothetical protein